ncbi:MAG: TfoX/Sxy family protein [Rhodospirillales bacterium]|nr:TfoX/Sxy family protein [Rhodospirillales bacterium]
MKRKPDDGLPLAALKNLGPRTARDLAEVGIETVRQLRVVGAVDAWRRLRHFRPRHYNLIGLYALAGALIDVHWNRLPPALKERLRAEAAVPGPAPKDGSPAHNPQQRRQRRSAG